MYVQYKIWGIPVIPYLSAHLPAIESHPRTLGQPKFVDVRIPKIPMTDFYHIGVSFLGEDLPCAEHQSDCGGSRTLNGCPTWVLFGCQFWRQINPVFERERLPRRGLEPMSIPTDSGFPQFLPHQGIWGNLCHGTSLRSSFTISPIQVSSDAGEKLSL